MVCFKQLYFHLKFFQKYREKWNVRDSKANFVKFFCIIFLVFSFCISLLSCFKLRESLGLCILSKKFFSKLNLRFNFLKLELRDTLEVGRGWRCKDINEMWMRGAAYVSPHEYNNSSCFCSCIVIWVVTVKRSIIPFY